MFVKFRKVTEKRFAVWEIATLRRLYEPYCDEFSSANKNLEFTRSEKTLTKTRCSHFNQDTYSSSCV